MHINNLFLYRITGIEINFCLGPTFNSLFWQAISLERGVSPCV